MFGSDKASVFVTATYYANLQPTDRSENQTVDVTSTQTSQPVIATITPTVFIAPTPELIDICVTLTKRGDSLGSLLYDFGVAYDPNGTYYYYTVCEEGEESLICSQRNQVADSDEIEVDWWIVIPNVLPLDCAENGGVLASGSN
jgi:hypothetical protein